jgi:hypothetical protein
VARAGYLPEDFLFFGAVGDHIWKMTPELLKQIIEEVLKSSGPWAVLFVLVVWRHLRYIERQTAERLKDKDREIDRLVGERNWLQGSVVLKLKSSQDKEKKDDA